MSSENQGVHDRLNGAESARDTRVLAGKNALVFGGGSGIGLGIARWLVRDGASVTIASRDTKRLEEVVPQLTAYATDGASVSWTKCDATDEEQVESAVAGASKVVGLDICVTSVGGSTNVPLLLCSAETFRSDIDRNLVSAFLAIKYGGAAMAQNGGGAFVAVSSDAAKLSFPYVGPYCAAKAGLEALVRVAADELGKAKVRVNAVRPGLVATERNANLAEDKEIHDKFVEEKALGRIGNVDDVAAAVCYLVGPDSSWVTGTSFAVDGGAELRKAPSLELIARRRYGDQAVEAAMRGEIWSAQRGAER